MRRKWLYTKNGLNAEKDVFAMRKIISLFVILFLALLVGCTAREIKEQEAAYEKIKPIDLENPPIGVDASDVPSDLQENCETLKQLCEAYPRTHKCLEDGSVYPDVLEECQEFNVLCETPADMPSDKRTRIKKFISEIYNQRILCEVIEKNK